MPFAQSDWQVHWCIKVLKVAKRHLHTACHVDAAILRWAIDDSVRQRYGQHQIYKDISIG